MVEHCLVYLEHSLAQALPIEREPNLVLYNADRCRALCVEQPHTCAACRPRAIRLYPFRDAVGRLWAQNNLASGEALL
eukprot:scaffold177268_cov28-Tisochrysis_lutea.AAC.3